MRTDPRSACANAEERLGWALVHDAIAHPLMALTGWSQLSVAFHDWTSHRAWPRPKTRLCQADSFPHPVHGILRVREIEPLDHGFWAVDHGKKDRTVCVQARDMEDALAKGIEQYDLQDKHEETR